MFRLWALRLAILLAISVAVLFPVQSQAAGITITPSLCQYPNIYIPLKSSSCTFAVTNNSGAGVQVTKFVLSGSQFLLINGLAPWTLAKGDTAFFTAQFAPTQAGRATGTMTVYLSNNQTLTGRLQGTGIVTAAATSLSTSAIDFGSLAQGQTSSQPVTITNTGTQSALLTGVTVDPPFYTDPISASTPLPAGGSYTFNVYFNPGAVGSFHNTVVAIYDSLLPQGIDVTGTGVAASSISITTFANLPAATVNAPYYANLTETGGVPPYRWRLAQGSVLPAGLTLSTNGVIQGTVTAPVASYSFSVQAQDTSSPPKSTTAKLMLTVGRAPGSNCANTSWNIAGTNSPILGLDVLGTGTYLGSEGGLYPNGSNVDDPNHVAFGVGLGQKIQPLDANGNPDPNNGKEVVLIIGESNVYNEGLSIVQDAMASPGKNPKVVVVDGAQGGATAAMLQDPNAAYWTTMINYRLPNSGVTAKQVVAVWMEPTNGINSGTFPSDMDALHSEVKAVVQDLQILFPNIKLAYLSSRTYAAYSNGIVTDNPEPYAYESGFPVKWTIEDQLNGDPTLNFDPSKGPVMAPWISWGPYYWANGLLVPTPGGLVWSCQDFKDDGTHPTTMGANPGSEKVANQVLNFLKTDPTAVPWFVAP